MSDTQTQAGAYRFYDFKPAAQDIVAEVLQGLSSTPKTVSPKYFYDAKGSALFEAITQLPEYYLTRTELGLFDRYLTDIAQLLPDRLSVVEYGSGSSLKIRRLLDTLTPTAYVPVDISAEHLQSNAQRLHQDFPGLHVYPVCADITRQIVLPQEVSSLTQVAFYPGSSIGNFEPDAAVTFLHNVRQTIGTGGYLLLGVDRKKDIAMLEAAYDDAAGVTAEFNLNVLQHLNDELAADFDLQMYQHVARYNSELGCIQMFLRSKVEQQVNVHGQLVEFAAGELIHTESSYKYHPQEFQALAQRAGFQQVHHFTDEQAWFSFFVLVAQ